MYEIAIVIATLGAPFITVWLGLKIYNEQQRQDTVIAFLAKPSTDPSMGASLNAIRTQFIKNKKIQKAMQPLLGVLPSGVTSITPQATIDALADLRKLCAVETKLCSVAEADIIDFYKEFK